MNFLSDLIIDANNDLVQRLENLIENTGLREKVANEAENLAQRSVNVLIDPECDDITDYKGINIEDDILKDEYLLVLEYLQSVGLKFTPQAARFESQNPDLGFDRVELANKYGLRSYDRTPLLVQMIEDRLRMIGNE